MYLGNDIGQPEPAWTGPNRPGLGPAFRELSQISQWPARPCHQFGAGCYLRRDNKPAAVSIGLSKYSSWSADKLLRESTHQQIVAPAWRRWCPLSPPPLFPSSENPTARRHNDSLRYALRQRRQLGMASSGVKQGFPKLGPGPQVGSPNYFVGSSDDWLNVQCVLLFVCFCFFPLTFSQIIQHPV